MGIYTFCPVHSSHSQLSFSGIVQPKREKNAIRHESPAYSYSAMTTITTALTAVEGETNRLFLNSSSREHAVPDTHHSTGTPAADYKYARFLPSYDQNLHLAPLEPFTHIDPGHAALKHADPQSFLSSASVKSLSPKFGSEVDGIQLSGLDDRAKR